VFQLSLFAFTFVLLTGSLSFADLQCGCANDDMTCLDACYISSPIFRSTYWNYLSDKPLEERVVFANEDMVSWRHIQQLIEGKTPTVKTTMDVVKKALVVEAIERLPSDYKRLASEKVKALILVEGLGYNGMADATFPDNVDVRFDELSDVNGGFVFINVDSLIKKLNEAKAEFINDRTFEDSSGYTVTFNYVNSPEDNNSLAYTTQLVSHEMAHVISFGSGYIPYPWLGGEQIFNLGKAYPFFDFSWRVDPQTKKLLLANGRVEPQLNLLKERRLLKAELPVLLEGFAENNFPSFYASFYYSEDFADSFSEYLWVYNFAGKKDMILWKNGISVKTYPSCFTTGACADKKLFYDRVLGR